MQPNSETVLRIDSLTVAIKKQIVLRDINCVLRRGGVLGLIGPNGAGKTSLLRAIASDLVPQLGTISLAGKPIQDWQRRPLACHRGFLTQHSSLDFPFTVREVVALSRLPHDSGLQMDRAIVNELLERLDIFYVADSLYTQLSGGEKQRVQLARVIAQLLPLANDQPRLLLLDEPCTGLDLKHQKLLLDYLKNLAEQGVSIVVSCHDLNWVTALCQQVLALKTGSVHAFGGVNEVMRESVLESLFDLPITIQDLQPVLHQKVRWL